MLTRNRGSVQYSRSRRRRYAGPMLPLIGVSTYVADVAWASWERRAAVLPASYFELVAAAGGRPLLLPPT